VLLRPSLADHRSIVHDLGRIIGVVAMAAVLPFGWALLRAEWHAASHFLLLIGIATAISGAADRLRPDPGRAVDWSHGMVVASLTWLLVPLLATVPLWASGHYSRWVDSYFDAMSGITTTGLSLIQDLDHLPESVNLWRHILQFLGGQGIILAALMFLAGSGALSLFEGEGREHRMFPNVRSTARFIWLVSAAHAVFGIGILTLDGIFVQGFGLRRAFFHASTIFMAAFDTGGFSPMSTSIAYYNSPIFEAIVAVLMIAGAMSFGLHHAIWQRRKGIGKNIEVRTFAFTVGVTIVITILGLALIGAIDELYPLVRVGLFHALSAHTGTGFATVSGSELASWNGLAFAGIAIGMALGGMSSSTAGGVKSLRIGLAIRAMRDTVREALLPDGAVVSRTFQQHGPQRLGPNLVRSVFAITLLYVALYLFGAAVALGLGYELGPALFESISASAAVGLSVGVVTPDMPILLEVVYIAQMWVGRLEFIAVAALIGFAASTVFGK
jgi:trk system potassium uptake protein TrkH